MKKNQRLYIFIIYTILILSFIIPILCIWYIHTGTYKESKIENYVVHSDSRLLDGFGSQNVEKTRGNDNRHLTFPSFHFHADRQGFLRVGDFVMQWGSGYGSEKNEDKYNLPMDLGSTGINMAVVGIPYGLGGGEHNLKLVPKGSGKIMNYIPGNSEKHYVFLALGFSPFQKYESKITHLKDDRINKRLKYMSLQQDVSSDWNGSR